MFRVSETFIGDLGLQQSAARSTMSDVNKKLNYEIFKTYSTGFRINVAVVLTEPQQSHPASILDLGKQMYQIINGPG